MLWRGGDLNDRSLCFLTNFVDGLEQQSHKPALGRPLAPFFPEDARIYMDEDHPGVKLSSLIGNSCTIIIVAKPLQEVIEQHCRTVNIEYLPVSIYDHRRRLRGKDYFIVNPIGSIDCLDREASTIEWDPDDPTGVIAIDEYVLDRDKVASAPQLFRVDLDEVECVVGPELSEAILEGGFTNVDLTPLRVNRP
jgi:hypothetical protein